MLEKDGEENQNIFYSDPLIFLYKRLAEPETTVIIGVTPLRYFSTSKKRKLHIIIRKQLGKGF